MTQSKIDSREESKIFKKLLEETAKITDLPSGEQIEAWCAECWYQEWKSLKEENEVLKAKIETTQVERGQSYHAGWKDSEKHYKSLQHHVEKKEISTFTIKQPRPKGFEPNPKRVKYYFLHRVMWRLFPPERWLHRWLRDKGGKVQLENETWIVHQSDDFHKYCYDKAYKDYVNAITPS